MALIFIKKLFRKFSLMREAQGEDKFRLMRKAEVDDYLDGLLREVDRLLAYPNWLPIQRCQISFYYQKLSSFSREFRSFAIQNENCEYELIGNKALSDLVSEILILKHYDIDDPRKLHLVGDCLASQLAEIYKAFMQDPQDFALQFYFEKSEHWLYEWDGFVGFQEESSYLLQQLVSITNKQQLQVISIAGMAGLGKTTLATKLYNDPCVVSHFHVRAWLTISQFYHKTNSLLRILSSVIGVTYEVCEKNNKMPAQALYYALKGRRYLIVIDDIWSNEAWDDFKRSFPDDENGSRIMLTTRFQDVALHAQPEGNPLSLRFLNDEESFDLFTSKASEYRYLHGNLSGIGRSITQKCRGLPLAIVVIAGLLKNNMDRDWWMHVEERLSSYIVSDENQYMDTLALSYNHLPQHLRPCFLSFGAFLEYHDIPVRNLLSLWIAEGFIHQDSTKRTFEDVAEKYLMDLIRRNLVVVGNKGSTGVIKTCRIHDLLRDLCLRKAEEASFSLSLTNAYSSHFLQGTNSDIEEFQVHEKDVFIGFQVEANDLLQQLASITRKQLEVISIVGMAGLGKTTLARRLYHDPYVVSYFYVQAWVTFSQNYQKRDLLLGTLRSVTEITDEVSSMNDIMLAQALYRALKGRRYLIVIDDIWSNESWDDFKRSFPDDNNGSRVMITTRLQDVALHAQPEGNPLCLRFLTEEESFDLFKSKAFKYGYIFENLREIGRSITQKCHGLPLAIVVIAGLLKNNMDRDWWMQVEERVGSYIVSDENQYMDTLALSYNHLPQHLRPCFLSFGAFPEDHDIPVRKLLSLWIAEGFIHQDSTKRTLEDVGEKYLMDLIRRSLVVVGNKGSDGVIKTCRIHDLLRDLCLRKAEEEIFSSHICKYNKHSYSCSHSSTDHSTNARLLLSTNDPAFPSECDCYFSEVSRSFFEDVSIVWEACQIIRSLDLSSIELYIFPTELLQLVHLKYLELRFRTGNLPEFVSHLGELQTLIISSRMNMVLPSSIWKMTNLRHLCIKSGENLVNFSNVEEPVKLENLQTISLVSPTRPCQHIIDGSHNLQKLGLCGPLTTESEELTCPDLSCLKHLKTLKLLNTTQLRKPGILSTSFNIPGSLRNLTMSNTCLDWKEARVFRMIPNLEVLKLKFHAFVGNDWETSPKAFPRLKFLKLDELDIKTWRASRNHFPVLQRLELYRCPHLMEIPEDFGKICTVDRCTKWQVEERLDSNIVSDENQYMDTLELSYNHLPQHLRPCFLSFGAFPEDRDIPVQKLLSLWIAMGFIHQDSTNRTLEDVAEEYLMDLIGRILVVASKKGSNGAIETCFIHGLLRDLCLKKSQEENFSLPLANAYKSHLLQGTNSNIEEFQVEEKDVFIGFQVEADDLLKQLASITRKQLEVISIVGMAGLGKTTLARRLYHDPFVVSYFYVRTWVTFSQNYQKRDLLFGALRSFTEITDEVSSMNDIMLAQTLYRALLGRRYLIVIDDIWSNEAWDDFKNIFPDNKNGSRIMITTRLQDVALHAQPEGNPLCLRFLTDEESFDLFTSKAFEDGYIFQNLCGIGRSITQKCRGLPLAIVVIAGLLKNNMDRDWWMQVEERVGSYIVSDENQYMDTLALSYNHLPQHLRPCFLSFGAFPADHDIPVRKLLSLWIAEGFIHQDSTEITLEDVAEGYLMDLIRRSLVVVGNKGSTGVIKTCRIHDLLRDLCLRKAEEDICSSNIYKYNKHSYSCSHSLTDPSTKSRLLLCTNVPTISSECDCYLSEVSKSFFKDVSVVLEACQIIRSLDLSSIELYIFPTELLQLVRLKYLELRFRTGNPPESVSHLRELQTLTISSRMNMVLPNSMWKMTNLRHLCIKSGENLVNFSNVEEEPIILENLQTMSLVSPTRPCQHIIARSHNLHKLGLCGTLTTKSGDLTFPDLSQLMHLKTLKLLNTTPLRKPGSLSTSIIFPGNLRNLTMSNTCLDWKEARVFEMIPNLEVLKLKFHAFVGGDWETSLEAFPRLKVLKLDELNIKTWIASRDHFPVLQRLELYRCPHLLELPEDFGNICTLEWIKLSGCSEGASNSARDIQQEQESYGNDYLKILLIPGPIPC